MKIKTIIYLFLATFLTITSCKKKSDLALNLMDKGKKWVFINEEKYNKDSMTYAFYVEFAEDGKCQSLSVIDDAPPINIHGSEMGNWEYKEEDSALNVLGNEFKVLKIQEDTISVLRKRENWKALFINKFLEIDSIRKANR